MQEISNKISCAQQAMTQSLSDEASLIVARLKQLDGRKRPRKKASFINWIKSQCQGMANGAHPDAVCKELVNAKVIHESGADITYAIER